MKSIKIIFAELNERKSSSSSSGSPVSPKHTKEPKKQKPLSPARRRAQRRANNVSPRRKLSPRKIENEQGQLETPNEIPTKTKLKKQKTSNGRDNVNEVSPKTLETPEEGNKQEEEIVAKPETEKKNIAYTFPVHEETFIMDDKDMISNKVDNFSKGKNDRSNESESKPPRVKKKPILSPKRAKGNKVCTIQLFLKFRL